MFRTVQRFYQPSGRTNQMVGITPDIEIFAKPNISDEEKFRLREADIYPNGLEAVGPVWSQARTSELKELVECLANDDQSTPLALQAGERDQFIDYPLLKAQEVLKCQK
jgi:hypothetical protein